jgi:hypothetical protein
MKKIILSIMAGLMLLGTQAFASHRFPLSEYKNEICHGAVDYTVGEESIDCLYSDIAFEFAYAHDWASALGRALYLAKVVDREPGVVLVLENDTDGIPARRFLRVVEELNKINDTRIHVKLVDTYGQIYLPL